MGKQSQNKTSTNQLGMVQIETACIWSLCMGFLTLEMALYPCWYIYRFPANLETFGEEVWSWDSRKARQPPNKTCVLCLTRRYVPSFQNWMWTVQQGLSLNAESCSSFLCVKCIEMLLQHPCRYCTLIIVGRFKQFATKFSGISVWLIVLIPLCAGTYRIDHAYSTPGKYATPISWAQYCLFPSGFSWNRIHCLMPTFMMFTPGNW